MILRTEQIKKFISESSVVKPNILYPNLADLIKIGTNGPDIVMSKTNNNIFCTYTFPDTGFNIDVFSFLLVSEKALNAIVQTTSSETITIDEKDGLITIQGGRRERMQCPAVPLAEFPQEPLPSGDATPIDSEALYCIRVASNYILRAQLVTVVSFVHVGPHGVLGTNANNIVYHRKFDGLPTIHLGEEALRILRPDNGVMYSTHGNYDFFEYGAFRYGVIKSAISQPLDPEFPFKGATFPCFVVNRQRMLDFCTMVNYGAKNQAPTCVLKYNSQILTLTHNDPEFNVNISLEIDCEQNIQSCEPFTFSAKWMETLLKSLPYEKLTWLQAGKHFRLASPDDENYRGLLAGII